MTKSQTANVSTKFDIQTAGGGTLALAIAMLEDEHLDANPHAHYPFGDQDPQGNPKTGDAANFGVFKMNWYMIQRCPAAQTIIGNRPPGFAGVLRQVGTRINSDPELATRILLDAMNLWSIAPPNPAAPVTNNFWAGHRWGVSGLNNVVPPTDWPDTLRYYRVVQAIKKKCDNDKTIWTSTTRYGEYVPRK